MTWDNRSTSWGTRHNRRVRGGGTWGDQRRRLLAVVGLAVCWGADLTASETLMTTFRIAWLPVSGAGALSQAPERWAR
jgi:hypothetical protein